VSIKFEIGLILKHTRVVNQHTDDNLSTQIIMIYKIMVKQCADRHYMHQLLVVLILPVVDL
jgi:hypothetical protein